MVTQHDWKFTIKPDSDSLWSPFPHLPTTTKPKTPAQSKPTSIPDPQKNQIRNLIYPVYTTISYFHHPLQTPCVWSEHTNSAAIANTSAYPASPVLHTTKATATARNKYTPEKAKVGTMFLDELNPARQTSARRHVIRWIFIAMIVRRGKDCSGARIARSCR